MAQITKRSNGNYLIRVSCGYTPDGKHITQSRTFKPDKKMTAKQTEKALQKFVSEFEAECQGGQVVSVMKFETLAEEWLTDYAPRNERIDNSIIIDFQACNISCVWAQAN